MIPSFIKFNSCLQNFVWKMNNFDYTAACEVWPEARYNYQNDEGPQNHFWNKFLSCGRSPALFYSSLDFENRERIYNYVRSKIVD